MKEKSPKDNRKPRPKDFKQVLDELAAADVPFSPLNLYLFSDLDRKDLERLEAVWPDVPVERRRQLLEDLGELAEANFEVTFEAVSRMAMEDLDGLVRARAISNLWEVDNPDLIAPLLHSLAEDPVTEVRAAAASTLGNYVYLNELEELPPSQGKRVEDALLVTAAGDDEPIVRRRAIEALGFSARPEVPPLIESAYRSDREDFRASALFAMGRAADQRWATPVTTELHSPSPSLRFEAARAAGELELKETVPALTELLEDPDPMVREAAIWSLSQVGGPKARRALTELLAQAGEDESDFIQDALDNLEFTDELNEFQLMEIDLDEDGVLEIDDEDDDEDDLRSLN